MYSVRNYIQYIYVRFYYITITKLIKEKILKLILYDGLKVQ